MKLPVKERDTIPWLSKREIPAIRLLLSAWRSRRKDPQFGSDAESAVNGTRLYDEAIDSLLKLATFDLEMVARIEERMHKEEGKQ